MSCDPTRLKLSNSSATTLGFTVSPDPGSVNLTFQVDGLSIDSTVALSSGAGVAVIPAVTAGENTIYDATLQVGSGAAVATEVQIVEANVPQSVGVTVSSAGVTYCAPSGGGSGSGDLDSVTLTGGDGLEIISQGATAGAYTATLAADLKANGGVVFESNELAVDLSATSLTGTLPAASGGTGLTSVSTLLNSNTSSTDVGLGNVENTAVSTWAGSSNLTTLGTVGTGTWSGTTIAIAHGGTGATSAPMVGVITAADASAARDVLDVVNVGSYTGQIETVTAKTYTLDPATATARTLSGLYMKTGADSCTVTIKNGSDDVIAGQSVGTGTGSITISSNLSVAADSVLSIVVTAITGTPTDLVFSLEYTE